MTEDTTRIQRNGPRRREDRLRRIGEKALAAAFTIATALAIYFWNESRDALHDIAASKADIMVLRTEVGAVKDKLSTSEKLSETQRTEIRQDINRVEQKIERLLELSRRAQ